MYPAAVNGGLKGRRQKPHERPVDSVVEDIVRLPRMTKAGIPGQNGLIGDRRIIFDLFRPVECYKRRFFLGAIHHYRQGLRAPRIFPRVFETLVFWLNSPASLPSRHIRLLLQGIA
jgi:hypothetical protein